MKKLLHSLMLILFIAMLGSCIDKDYDISNVNTDGALTPTVALPVGSMKHTIDQVLRKIGIEDQLVYQNDTIFIIYKDSLKLESSNPVTIPEFPATAVPFIGGTNSEFVLDLSVDIPNTGPATARIDSAQLKNTTIMLSVVSALNVDAEFEVTLPQGIVLQNPSDAIFTVTANSTTVKHLPVVDNSILRLSNQNNDHKIELKYTLRTPGSITMNPGDVTAAFSFENMELVILWGFFGDVSMDEKNNNKLKLNVFDDLNPENKLLFSNPIIICGVRNYIGFNAEFNVNYITAKDEGGNTVSADFNGSPSFTLAMAAAPAPYAYSTQQVRFDKDNGGTNKLFEIIPDSLFYGFTTTPHSLSNSHFIVAGKYVDVDLEIKLPLSFNRGTNIVYRDTIGFDFTDEGIIDNVEDLVLGIKYENAIPLEFDLTLVFLDENNNRIEGISKEINVEAGTMEGGSRKPGEGYVSIKFIDDDWDNIRKAKNIILEAKTGVENDDSVNIRPDDYINLKLDVYTKAKLEF